LLAEALPHLHGFLLMKRIATVVLGLVAVAQSTAARGERDERRLGVRGQPAVASVSAFETSSSTEVVGGGLSLSFGATNALEFGADVSYVLRPDVAFEGAQLAGARGEGFVAYANLHQVELGGHARFALDRPFGPAVRPLVDLRAGLRMLRLSDPELFNEQAVFLTTAKDRTDFEPFLGLDAGIAWRITDGMELAALAGSTVSSSYRSVGLIAEVSWFWYRLI
jgi:hypothetical protein